MGQPHPALVDLAAGRQLPEVGDHAELLRSAVEHRMTGLLWSRAQEVASGAPPGWRMALTAEDLQNRARSHALWSELEDVVGALGDAGIRVAAAKGVTAEARWYDRSGERPCADLDLVIDPAQLDRVDDAVELVQPGHPLRGQLSRLAATSALSSVELRTARGIWVDLHFDVLKLGVRSRLREVIWSRTLELARPTGASIRVLDPESSMLLFLVHLNKDRFRTLLGFADVARISQREHVDWVTVDQLARTDGIETHVRLAHAAVARTLGLVPALPQTSGWRAEVWNVLWRPSVRLRGDEGLVRFRNRQVALALIARGRGVEGLGYAARRVFPRGELLRYRRPEGRGPYLWRLLTGRITTLRRQRRAVRDLRRAAGRAEPRVEVPTPGGG